MKKMIIGLSLFLFTNLLFAFDYMSIRDYLGKDFSVVLKDYPDMKIDSSTGVYVTTFYENDDRTRHYSISCFVANGKVTDIMFGVQVMSQNIAIEYFNKFKEDNKMTSGGTLVVNNSNEYNWVLSNIYRTIVKFQDSSNEDGYFMVFLIFMINPQYIR